MLDKSDLHAIKEVVDVSIEAALEPVKKDIADMKRDISRIMTEMEAFRKDLERVEAKLDRVIAMENEDVTATSAVIPAKAGIHFILF